MHRPGPETAYVSFAQLTFSYSSLRYLFSTICDSERRIVSIASKSRAISLNCRWVKPNRKEAYLDGRYCQTKGSGEGKVVVDVCVPHLDKSLREVML